MKVGNRVSTIQLKYFNVFPLLAFTGQLIAVNVFILGVDLHQKLFAVMTKYSGSGKNRPHTIKH